MNSVMLIGRLVRDPDIRYTSGSQMAVASFSIAIDRPSRNGGERQTDFPRITAFGKQAEVCERYLKKGQRVGIEGRLQTGSYTNKKGDTVYTTDIVANRVEIIDWPDRSGYGQNQGSSHYGNDYDNRGGYGSSPRQNQVQPGGNGPDRNGSAGQPDMDEMPEAFEAIDEDVPF